MSIFPKTVSGILLRNTITFLQRRYFLSNAFECTETWNSRLSNPLFQKVESEAMYYELASCYNRTQKINAIDVDIFVNAQNDATYITEVEELVHKLRMTNQAHLLLPTTPHGFVRLFCDHKKEDLPRILDDRLNYGIFPDNYLMAFLLNRYLKNGDYRRAAKIASLEMFQENFSNNLVKYMSLYSVLKYLTTNEPWDDPIQQEADEEEVVRVKVRVLRNPFFDDHFDLKDGQHICGKTLAMISTKMLDNLKSSVRMMGLALYNKWDKLEDHLTETVRQNGPVLLESLNFTKEVVKTKLLDTEKNNQIIKLAEELEKQNTVEGSLIDLVKIMVEEEITSCEQNMIDTQIQLYKDWDQLRADKLQQHLAEIEKRRRLEEVERRKEELMRKEEELYFFENEDEIDLTIERKELLIWKRTFRNKAATIDEDYIPPDAKRKTNTQ